MLVPDVSPPRAAAPAGRMRIAIFGSTGSIGRSALDLIRRNPERFEAYALIAGSSAETLAAQIQEFKPRFAALADQDAARRLSALCPECGILSGDRARADIARHPEVDTVLAAIVGSAGLSSTLAAVEAGKRVALANKESLVAAGALVEAAQARAGALILPVDSEHSALFQALQGHRRGDLHELILTASGGPFLHTPQDQLARITPAQAVKHPRWSMGAKISVDSATLVNKALELIEAHWLFSVPEQSIRVLVHPQSIIHSLVNYVDGTQIAQLSAPDMRGPIAYALSWPHGRLARAMAPLRLAELGRLEFFELDNVRFPAVELARAALRAGGAMPALFNIANEAAVAAFMAGTLRFDLIVPLIESVLARFGFADYSSLDELLALQQQGRRAAMEILPQPAAPPSSISAAAAHG